MLITRRSPMTGVMNSFEIDITEEQFEKWAVGGYKIQDAAPHLSADDREFILTGLTPEDWEGLQD